MVRFIYNHELEKQPEYKIKQLKNQVQKLLKIPQPEQRSQEWYDTRNNMITASDWATALGEHERSYKKSLILSKCGQSSFFTNSYMQHGIKYEPVANMIYEHRNNTKIIEFGLLPHPKVSFLGASPDGITEDGIMVEIKCPSTREITGMPKHYYWVQMQGQLEVCELDRCDFLECKIEEFETEEEYFNDETYEEMEKGIVINLYNKESRSYDYIYSKININNINEFELWRDCEIKKYNRSGYEYNGVTYWKLKNVSCVPVYRDREWFNNKLCKLDEFWQSVLYYRKNGVEDLKPKKKNIMADIYEFDYENNDEFNKTLDLLKTECLFSDTLFKKKCCQKGNLSVDKNTLFPKTADKKDSSTVDNGETLDENEDEINFDPNVCYF